MSPTGPNKYLRGITTSTTKTDQIELDLFNPLTTRDFIKIQTKSHIFFILNLVPFLSILLYSNPYII